MLAPRCVERVQLYERRFATKPLGDAGKFVVTKVNQALPFATEVTAAAPTRRHGARPSARWPASIACVRRVPYLQNQTPSRTRAPISTCRRVHRRPAPTTPP